MNTFKMKKFAAIWITGFIPLLMFIMFINFGYDFLTSIGMSVVGIVLGMVIFIFMVRHPIMALAEGAGLLVLLKADQKIKFLRFKYGL